MGDSSMRHDPTSSLERFARDEPIEMVVRGDSMVPALRRGDSVRVRARRLYWPGDIVAFRGDDGRLWMHRLVGYRFGRGGLCVVTRGDALGGFDSPVPRRRVIGRVVAVEGNAPEHRVTLGSRVRWVASWVRHVVASRVRR